MSFTTQVKEDLVHIFSSKPCCRAAEFIAFFLLCGHIRIGTDGPSLVMQTETSGIARKMFRLAKAFDLEREVSVFRRSLLKKNQVYQLLIPPQDKIYDFLSKIGVMDEEGKWALGFSNSLLKESFLAEPCCCRAYLRGALLAAGSVSDPESGSYHLELASVSSQQAKLLLSIMNGFGIMAKTIGRRDSVTIYLKGAEQISDFLNLVGSHRSLLQFESVRVTKEVRNQVNRLRNCDTANVEKAVAAADRQRQEIEYILANIALETLPENLRIVVELRLEHPAASLAELSELSGLGRSALNHRLRRLAEIAENIQDYGPAYWSKSPSL